MSWFGSCHVMFGLSTASSFRIWEGDVLGETEKQSTNPLPPHPRLALSQSCAWHYLETADRILQRPRHLFDEVRRGLPSSPLPSLQPSIASSLLSILGGLGSTTHCGAWQHALPRAPRYPQLQTPTSSPLASAAFSLQFSHPFNALPVPKESSLPAQPMPTLANTRNSPQ